MKLSRQAIFDKVALHLLQQRKPSTSPEGRCAYRGEDGTKCAAGIFIPDRAYTLLLEGVSADTLPAGCLPTVSTEDLSFLLDLQGIHDSANGLAMGIGVLEDPLIYWRRHLTAFATQFDLDPCSLKGYPQ